MKAHKVSEYLIQVREITGKSHLGGYSCPKGTNQPDDDPVGENENTVYEFPHCHFIIFPLEFKFYLLK